jgi:O-antigen/teichoic acid export membrane protein
MLRSFVKDSAIYAVPSFISRGLSLFLIPFFTRVLSPADYGSLDLLTVFAGIINLTIALEVSQGLARFYTAEQDSERKVLYASSAFWFTLACYTVFAVLMLISTDALAALIMGRPGLETEFQLGIGYIWVNGLFYLIQNQFRWELRSRIFAVVSLLMSFVTAGMSVWLAYGLHWGLEGLLIGMLVGSVVGTGLGLWWLRNSFCFRFDGARLREMLAFSAPLVFSGVAVWISLYIDRIMIGHYLSINDVGLYGIGYRLASVAGLVMGGFQGALTPLIYTYYREADTPRQLARIFRLFLLFALLIFLGLSLFALDILRLLTTEPFYGGAVVVVYLVPAMLLANMYIFAPGIGIAKKTHYFVWINTIGALLNVALNVLLIPTMGIAGAGLATMLGYLVVFAMYMTISQRLYHVPHHWQPIALSVLAAAVMAWWLPQLPLANVARWALNLLALAVFATISVALGLVRTTELQQSAALIKARLRFSSDNGS